MLHQLTDVLCCFLELTESRESPVKPQSSEKWEMATMTTMFSSLYYHIISRCSAYNSRSPPPPAGPLMFALCVGSKDIEHISVLCNVTVAVCF